MWRMISAARRLSSRMSRRISPNSCSYWRPVASSTSAASTLVRGIAPMGWLISWAMEAVSSPMAVRREACARRCPSSSIARRSVTSASAATICFALFDSSRTMKPCSWT